MFDVRRQDRSTGDRRRGSVLVIVLVVVAMLTLGAYTFSETMLSEAAATNMYGRRAQTRALADSGLEMVSALLSDEIDPLEISLYHDPLQFHAVTVLESDNPLLRGRFTIVAPVESDLDSRQTRFGLMDESARLNLNTILQLQLPAPAAPAESESSGDDSGSATDPILVVQREMLMGLPGMTEEIADSILDWLDEDDNPREFGVESDYYESLSPPYSARNGPIESLDELLKVAGVDSFLLFGEDANRNGLLDLNEDDGEERPPFDDADGILGLGWSAYLTSRSREVNKRADGSERINLNEGLLTELYDTIEEELGEEAATFIVAYRMYGSVEDPASGDFPSEQNKSVTRGGMDLSGGSRREIKSVYDLVGIEVAAEDTEEMALSLVSPWENDPSAMIEYLPDLTDAFTTNDDPFIPGRININQAREEVLQGLLGVLIEDPETATEAAATIIAARAIDPDTGEPTIDDAGARATNGWLVIEGVVDLPTMRKLDPFLTTRGNVFRMQVVGYFDTGGPFTRLEAVIDASEDTPKLVFVRDLTELGKGFSYQALVPEE